MCILAVYTLLNVDGYYDLSVLSMSVMGLKNTSLDGVWVGGVSSIQKKLGFLEFVLIYQHTYMFARMFDCMLIYLRSSLLTYLLSVVLLLYLLTSFFSLLASFFTDLLTY